MEKTQILSEKMSRKSNS